MRGLDILMSNVVPDRRRGAALEYEYKPDKNKLTVLPAANGTRRR